MTFIPSILRLLKSSSPFAVIGLVVLVVIYSLNGEVFGGASAHIRYESLETIRPLWAKFDTPSPIIGIRLDHRIFTSILHPTPYSILGPTIPSTVGPMCKSPISSRLFLKTSTTFGYTFEERCGGYNFVDPTITDAKYSKPTLMPSGTNYTPSTESETFFTGVC